MPAGSMGTHPWDTGVFKGLLQSELHAAQAALIAEHEAAQKRLAASHEHTIGIVTERLELVRREAVKAFKLNTGTTERVSAVAFQLSNGAVEPSKECCTNDVPTAISLDDIPAALGQVKISLASTASPLSPLEPDDGLSEASIDSGVSSHSATYGETGVRISSKNSVGSDHTASSAGSAHGMRRNRTSTDSDRFSSNRGSRSSGDRNSGKSSKSSRGLRFSTESAEEEDAGIMKGTLSGSASKMSSLMKRYSVVQEPDIDTPVPQFQVLPVWNFRRSAAMTFGTHRRSYRSQPSFLLRGQTSDDEEEPAGRKSFQFMQAFDWSQNTLHIIPTQIAMSPNSGKRGFWDFMSLLLVAYDMVMIPLQQLEPPENLLTRIMEWVTRIFWTLDIPASLITGYITMEGSIELRLRPIIRRYLHTWFALDITIVSLDWLEIIVTESTQGVDALRMGKASRIFRIVRMVRLLRLVRIQQVITIITERICSERLIIVADILKIMILIVGIAHVLGCMWYGIGSVEDDADRWVYAHNYNGTSLAERYTMSLHWSLSQFTGGMDEVTPQNALERMYTIVVFIFGFITASLFLGSLTSSMTQLQIIGTNQSQQLAILRKYLRQNQITNKLALRVQRNAKHVLQEQQRFMPEASVELLALVSEPLRVEIHFEMYSVVFQKHPFFAHYIEACPQVMRKVCHEAMSSLPVSRGDIIFNAGEIPSHPKMYFIGKGDFKYTSMFDDEVSITEGSWLAEATLWTSWMHRGALVASGECRVFVLDAKSFQRIVTEFDHPDFDPLLYAKDFVAELNECGGNVSDIYMTRYEENNFEERNSQNGLARLFGKVRRGSKHSNDGSSEVSSVFSPSASGERRWSKRSS